MLVTGLHMIAEYQSMKTNIINELKLFETIFYENLLDTVWNLDSSQINTTLQGINRIPEIKKVVIKSNKANEILGKIEKPQSHASVFKDFFHHFELIHKNDDHSSEKIADVYFYSNESFVFEKVKPGFLFIMVNALIKTTALWIIFLWFGRKLLSKPLEKLILNITNLDFNQLDDTKINIETSGNNELKLLETSFNQMILKLISAKNKLNQLHNKLLLEKDNAEAANKAKSSFLTNVSHELRTPLNIIIGFSSSLCEDIEEYDDPELLTNMKNIENAGQHLLSMIEDIIDISKIDTGKLNINFGTFKIEPIIKQAADNQQVIAKKQQNQILMECPENIGTMYSDQFRLLQILNQLLNNACKFTQQSLITIKVYTSTQQSVESICFEIHDQGIGISENKINMIFQLFNQSDNSITRPYEGLGLGLFLVHQLTILLKGDISVQSEFKKGSIFTLKLPRHTQDDEMVSHHENNNITSTQQHDLR